MQRYMVDNEFLVKIKDYKQRPELCGPNQVFDMKKKINLGAYFILITKLKSRIFLIMKGKIIQRMEENIGEYLCDFKKENVGEYLCDCKMGKYFLSITYSTI